MTVCVGVCVCVCVCICVCVYHRGIQLHIVFTNQTLKPGLNWANVSSRT